jgi:hypothetical protein
MTTPPPLPVKAPPAPYKPPDRLEHAFDPPKVRMSMNLFPADPQTEIRVREGPNCVFLDFETKNITLKTIRLTLREARTMAVHMNRIAYRVQHRPADRP